MEIINLDKKRESFTINLYRVIATTPLSSRAKKEGEGNKGKFIFSYTIDVGFRTYTFTSDTKKTVLEHKKKFDALFVNRHKDGRGIVVEV